MSPSPTVDLEGLARLPVHRLPPTYHLGTPGMGCFLDPPGYPTYYLQPVYTARGDAPPYGRGIADAVLWGRVVSTTDDDGSLGDDRPVGRLLASLYRPLPKEDPRVSAWVAEVFRHLRGCYARPEGVPAYAGAGPLVPSCGDAMPEGWARPENLSAVRMVRKTYPDFQPSEALLNGPDSPPTDWWERAPSDQPASPLCDCPLAGHLCGGA